MSDQKNSDNGTPNDPPRPGGSYRTSKGIAGAAWLIVWFMLCFFGIISIMAAQDFQKRLVGATDNTKYSVGYAIDQVDVLKDRRTYWKDRVGAESKAEADYMSTHGSALLALRKATSIRASLSNMFSRLSAKLQSTQPAFDGLGDLPTLDGLIAARGKAREELQRLEVAYASAALIASPASAAILKIELDSVRNQTDDFAFQVQVAQDADALLDAAFKARGERKADTDGALKNLSAAPFDNRDFEQLADDLARYKSLLGGIPFYFVEIPGIALTLLLTVLMGILGSLIAVTRGVVFEHDQITAGEYLFRIALGAAVAFAIFFFSAVGAITFAQSAAGSQPAQPSPFLVSFFGIVAGYLSHRVTDWMRESGGRVFQVRSEADRWAIDLKAALAAAGVTAKDMADTIGQPPEKIDAWIARQEPISIDVQGLISAYVRQPTFKLFTDIKPPA